jgi:hypothetical protein
MRNTAVLLGLATLSLLMLSSAPNAAACPGCSLDPWCEAGPGGTLCEVYEHRGQRWRRDLPECDSFLTTTPLEVPPAGTHLARGGAQVMEGGVITRRCNGFIAGHGGESRMANEATIRL